MQWSAPWLTVWKVILIFPYSRVLSVAKPSASQAKYLDYEIGASIHFNMQTFNGTMKSGEWVNLLCRNERRDLKAYERPLPFLHSPFFSLATCYADRAISLTAFKKPNRVRTNNRGDIFFKDWNTLNFIRRRLVFIINVDTWAYRSINFF